MSNQPRPQLFVRSGREHRIRGDQPRWESPVRSPCFAMAAKIGLPMRAALVSALFSAPDAQSLGPPLRCSDTFDGTIL